MRRGAGFTLIELVIVIVLVSSLAAVALERLLIYQELAEKAAMEYTASALRSALRMRIAELMVAGRMQELRLLEGGNPMTLLDEPPENYSAEPPRQGGPQQEGSWFFDGGANELVYQVRRGGHFAAAASEAKQVRYRLVVTYATAADAGNARIAVGARLELVRPYHWLERT